MNPHQSLLEFAGGRYAKLALVLCGGAIAAYAWHEPPSASLKPHGGTSLGYTLGTVAALLILWLMLLGLRKRSYASNLGSVLGWTSAHVYLGTSLIVIATLHCAFEFGWNIHTLAYALMMGVVGSGFFGVFCYLRYPARMAANLSGETLDGLLAKMNEQDRKCQLIALDLPDAFNELALKASVAAVRQAQPRQGLRLPGSVGRRPLREARDALIQLGAELEGAQVQVNERLVAEMTRLLVLADRVRRELNYRALLKGWLMLHVPLSFALLAALTAHVISVFYLW